jgi:DNA polymerase-3 subunit epsilon
LDFLAEHLGIEFDHHHAYEDALACAKIGIKACEKLKLTNLYELANQLEISHGHLKEREYKPCLSIPTYKSLKSLKATKDPSELDPHHPFYGKTVVFTGTLQSMTRKEAGQKVLDVGGSFHNGITKESNFLVMGIQDYSSFADGKHSSKTRKATKLISEGQDLEIIDEIEFIRLLNINSTISKSAAR